MTRTKMSGIMVNGSVRTAGVTMYTKNGKTIVRSAHSIQPKRRSKAQFDVRQRMRHTTALWQRMGVVDLVFSSAKSTYAGFASQANRLPVVYIPNNGALVGTSLLMPGIPVCEGTLTPVELTLGEVDGRAALLTDLKRNSLNNGDKLRLYTVMQCIEGSTPRIQVRLRDVSRDEFTTVDGRLALVDNQFADTMKGWALVRFNGERCSTQNIVTNCTYYEQFTTDEALQAAAKSYGGLTK